LRYIFQLLHIQITLHIFIYLNDLTCYYILYIIILLFQEFFTHQTESNEINLNVNDNIYFTNSPSQNLYNLEVGILHSNKY